MVTLAFDALQTGRYDFDEFVDGEYVFEIERRPGQLAVWLEGHADQPATVPVEDGSDTLRVTVFPPSSDNLPVQFSPGETQY